MYQTFDCLPLLWQLFQWYIWLSLRQVEAVSSVDESSLSKLADVRDNNHRGINKWQQANQVEDFGENQDQFLPTKGLFVFLVQTS